jgi:hypothetical protein
LIKPKGDEAMRNKLFASVIFGILLVAGTAAGVGAAPRAAAATRLADICDQIVVCGTKDGVTRAYPNRCAAVNDQVDMIGPRPPSGCANDNRFTEEHY